MKIVCTATLSGQSLYVDNKSHPDLFKHIAIPIDALDLDDLGKRRQKINADEQLPAASEATLTHRNLATETWQLGYHADGYADHLQFRFGAGSLLPASSESVLDFDEGWSAALKKGKAITTFVLTVDNPSALARAPAPVGSSLSIGESVR
jgi:hypothetical protein